MSEELVKRAVAEELAKRAVASPHWRWTPGMLSRCSTVEEGIWREFMSPWRGYRDHVCAMSAFVHPSGFWFEVSDFALVMFSASIAAHLRRSAEVAIEGGATGLHMAEVERIIDDGGVTGWSVVWRRVAYALEAAP